MESTETRCRNACLPLSGGQSHTWLGLSHNPRQQPHRLSGVGHILPSLLATLRSRCCHLQCWGMPIYSFIGCTSPALYCLCSLVLSLGPDGF